MSNKTKLEPTRIGTLHDGCAMFICIHAGEATSGKNKYSMSTSMGGNPIVRSEQTKQSFSLSWKDIINLAISAGIDKPMAKEAKEAKKGKNK